MPRSFPLSLKKKETLFNGQRMEYSKLISAQVFFVFPPYMSIYIFFFVPYDLFSYFTRCA